MGCKSISGFGLLYIIISDKILLCDRFEFHPRSNDVTTKATQLVYHQFPTTCPTGTTERNVQNVKSKNVVEERKREMLHETEKKTEIDL